MPEPFAQTRQTISYPSSHGAPFDPGPDEAAGEELHLLEYWRVITSYKWGIFGLIFVATLIGTLTAFSMEPVYIAKVTMLIEPDQPKFVSMDPLQNATNSSLFYKTQLEIIRSRSVAKLVIDKLALDRSPEFVRSEREKAKKLPLNLDFWLPKGWLDASWWKGPKKDRRFEEDKQAKLITKFLKRLSVADSEKSQIVTIKFEASNARLASKIANVIADSYIETGMESRLAVVKQATSWLTERLADLRKQVTLSETALQRYQAREGVVGSESQKDIISKKLTNITQELVKAQTKRVEAEIAYNQVRKADEGVESYDSLLPVLTNQLIQRLKQDENHLQRQMAELSERYGSKHPKMIAAKSDLKTAQEHLKQEIAKVVNSIRNEYTAAVENERQLVRLNERMKSDVRRMSAKEFQMAKLEREVEANRQLYNLFLTRFKETDISGNNNVTNIRVIDRAEPPVEPSKPRKGLIIIASMMAGMVFGVIIAFVREHLDKTFKFPEDIERVLNLPVLGSLYYLKKERGVELKPETYGINNPKSPFAEAVNNIRTSVLFANLDMPPKIILVTSATPNEGKTTLACNLAASLSRLGKTLLVDADLRKPGLAQVFDIQTTGGLSAFVTGQKSLRQAAVSIRKGVDNLHILPSGIQPVNPLEFLSSKRFSVALDLLKKEFAHIVIDAAPLLPYSDAIALSHIADEIILIIRADQTSHAEAQDALKRLLISNVSPLGAVLSYVNPSHMEGYGGYYYYYAQHSEEHVDKTA